MSAYPANIFAIYKLVLIVVEKWLAQDIPVLEWLCKQLCLDAPPSPQFFRDEKLLPLYQSERREPAIQMEISLPQSALIPAFADLLGSILLLSIF